MKTERLKTTWRLGAAACASVLMVGGAVAAPIIDSSNVAVYASATYRNGGGGTSSTTVLNDQNAYNQLDAGNNTTGSWAALIWANNTQDLSRVILEFVPTAAGSTYMVQGFDIQKSVVANPSGANDSDWQTVRSFTSPADYPMTQNSFALSLGVKSTGLRIVQTGLTPFAGDDLMRLGEFWAFSAYDNLALSATVSAPGWVSPGNLRNEVTMDQSYGAYASNPTNTFTWSSVQRIGGVLITGGNGSYPKDFSIQAWNGASWSTVTNITGNTQLSQYIVFPDPVFTDRLLFNYTASGGSLSGDGLMRVGEIFIFAIPEPSVAALLGLGGSVLLLRRRATNRL